MKLKSLPQFFNTAITLLFSFVAIWTVLISFKLSRILALILSIVIALLISSLVFILSATPSKSNLKILRRNKLYALMDRLNTCTSGEILKIFQPIFNELHISASVTDEHISLSNGIKIHLAFLPSQITDNELIAIYRKYREENLVVFSSGFTVGAYTLAKKLKIKLISGEEIYSLLEKFNALPSDMELKKMRFTDGIGARLFSKKNGIRFIILGFTLIIIAFAVFYPLYYYVLGVLFVIYGFACLFFNKDKITHNENIEDIFNVTKNN